jgi:hypothetical protein
MKGKYGGPMSVDEFYQAMYQDRDFFDRHGITHVCATYLYFTPCDASGQPVVISDEAGNPIDGYMTAGGYRSAADAYESDTLTPSTVRRTPSMS